MHSCVTFSLFLVAALWRFVLDSIWCREDDKPVVPQNVVHFTVPEVYMWRPWMEDVNLAAKRIVHDALVLLWAYWLLMLLWIQSFLFRFPGAMTHWDKGKILRHLPHEDIGRFFDFYHFSSAKQWHSDTCFRIHNPGVTTCVTSVSPRVDMHHDANGCSHILTPLHFQLTIEHLWSFLQRSSQSIQHSLVKDDEFLLKSFHRLSMWSIVARRVEGKQSSKFHLPLPFCISGKVVQHQIHTEWMFIIWQLTIQRGTSSHDMLHIVGFLET
jgi:hypothetical protein